MASSSASTTAPRWSFLPSTYLHAWLPATTIAQATPTPFTKDADVDGWVFLGKETDIKSFTYADVAAGKREEVVDETNKDYVWLPTLPDTTR